MIIVYGLFCNQFPFLQHRAKKNHKYNKTNSFTNDELFLVQTLKYPLSIQQLIIYPPVLKKEMLLVVHALEYRNWSVGQIASFCKAIQRLTYIKYEYQLYHSKKKSKHRSNRSYCITNTKAKTYSKSNRSYCLYLFVCVCQ